MSTNTQEALIMCGAREAASQAYTAGDSNKWNRNLVVLKNLTQTPQSIVNQVTF